MTIWQTIQIDGRYRWKTDGTDGDIDGNTDGNMEENTDGDMDSNTDGTDGYGQDE